MSATSPREYKAAMTADVTLPSGKVFTLRRPPLHVWKAHGRIPNVYLNLTALALDDAVNIAQVARFGGDLVQAQLEQAAKLQRKVAEMTDDDKKALAEFELAVVVESVISPRMALDAAGDADILTPADLDGVDYQFILAYGLNNAPDVPIATTEGGTMPESVVKGFRQKPTGKRAAQSRGNVRPLRRAAK